MPKSIVYAVLAMIATFCNFSSAQEDAVHLAVAEGETFTVKDDKGWALTRQDHSLASHTYGGMWVTHGALLGAPADSVGSVAEKTVRIPAAGDYRVWSKYQAPPYFNYMHRVEVLQGGQVVYSHDYGKAGTDRLWSFSADSDELWWFWGVDHDAAESPAGKFATLSAGPAIIRLTTLESPAPAGGRFVDFVVLTTNKADDYIGKKPYKVASPFVNEAFSTNELYMRFKNTSGEAAQINALRKDHFQPNYGSAKASWPTEPVAAGAWSEWVNIGPFLRLVHNEALWLTVKGAETVELQFSRDATGAKPFASVSMPSGEAVYIPMEIIWDTKQTITPLEDLIAETTKTVRAWPKANGGKKAQKYVFYGAFRGPQSAMGLKDALGYNTLLPEQFETLKVDGYHQHANSEKAIRALAEKREDPSTMRVVSFGDEIHLGHVNRKDPKMKAAFVAFLKAEGLTEKALGVKPEAADLETAADHPHLAWYATIFEERERFAHFKHLTAVAKEVFGPQVLTGANYSPHLPPGYYGPVGQWIDIFRYDGMSMFWSEDYVFSVAESPQIASWQLAMARVAVRHNGQPIHWYVMPHAPGQPAEMLYRNMIFAAGNGAAHIDSFWVGPQEHFTENYVAWDHLDSFKALHDSIYQIAEVEDVLIGGTVRPARIALLVSKATQVNEDRLLFDAKDDPFTALSANAAAKGNTRWLRQSLCRKDQQATYLALRQAQYQVDLITEDDIYDRGVLQNYDVLYFSGEWIDNRTIAPIDAWVKAGGTLFAAGGLGHLNQYGEPEEGLLKLLGVARTPIDKKLYLARPLLEMPLAEPVGSITYQGGELPMIGWKQPLQPQVAIAESQWKSGEPAVVSQTLGQGETIAVGGLPGISWLKTGLKPVPYARGGYHNLYTPVPSDETANALITLPMARGGVTRQIVTSSPAIEATVIDGPGGSVATLVNWTMKPIGETTVSIAMPKKPTSVRSIKGQAAVPFTYADGRIELTMTLDDADFLLIK